MHLRLPRIFSAPLLAAAFYLSVSSSGLAEPRVWTNVDGREITAELLDATESSVKLEVGGKEFDIPLEKLSAADNAFVKEWLAAAAERKAAALADQMTFGGVVIEPGAKHTFERALNPYQQEVASCGGKNKITNATIGIAVPADFDPAATWPVFIVNATSGGKGSSVTHMNAYWKLATDKGWVVLAAENSDGKPPLDDASFRFGVIMAAFDEMNAKWPGSEKWPLAFGGNSGGAKHSGYVGALFTRTHHVIGIFMGGCNEDSPTHALNLYEVPEKKFLKVPLYLANGLQDKIAGDPYPAKVTASMAATGFENVRAERFEGGHSVNEDQVIAALDWFREMDKGAQ